MAGLIAKIRGLSDKKKKKFDSNSIYSVVSCSDLTPGSLEIWVDLPNEIKFDPSLAPFKHLYEQHHDLRGVGTNTLVQLELGVVNDRCRHCDDGIRADSLTCSSSAATRVTATAPIGQSEWQLANSSVARNETRFHDSKRTWDRSRINSMSVRLLRPFFSRELVELIFLYHITDTRGHSQPHKSRHALPALGGNRISSGGERARTTETQSMHEKQQLRLLLHVRIM
ncbi:hypothetical protein EVAR_87306_1 [Eumeta japonica]|uniref:Uncharacterized protein n=1 Tax=Eumeta variegata TaxID=151549 RepID=A0A4C1VUQ1_EUMVA|nr:hypothetical protein EVAR_87306_1 [Eumeta japonica]